MLTLQEIYELGLKLGIENDPRGKAGVKRVLDEAKKTYEKLSKKEKEYFDAQSLHNPYADSRILTGNPKMKVKTLIAGIDLDGGELMLAKTLGANAAFVHHPEGRSLIDLDRVMDLQIDTLAESGVPVNLGHKSMQARMTEIRKAVHATNAFQNTQLAEALGLGFLCMHTMADNITETFVKNHLGKKSYHDLEEIIEKLLEIPEYHEAAKRGDGPIVFAGSPKARAGKVHVFMTGGTSPGDDIYEKLVHAGVGTIIEMHLSASAVKKAEKHGLNVIVAGHIASDSIGVNLILDQIEKKGTKVISLGGMIRIKRK